MKRYVATASAIRISDGSIKFLSLTGILDAASDAEAEGLAIRECRRIFPAATGWANHSVGVHELADLGRIEGFEARP